MKIINDWKIIILLLLTLGLAPYFPEPHVWGKVKWVMGGAVGMKPMDWFDLALHSLPFFLLIRLIIVNLLTKRAKKD